MKSPRIGKTARTILARLAKDGPRSAHTLLSEVMPLRRSRNWGRVYFLGEGCRANGMTSSLVQRGFVVVIGRQRYAPGSRHERVFAITSEGLAALSETR